ncbi:hypothetical protein ACO22_06061 [Paracoccidioides brasiliensis]|uniref:Major facilitator superfamily (MFS) profile domain-containing protein n=1 Tax=Paracoccidioides brasiliensis TaxID=121759 RepID=A0A1D2J8I7_PARBR|nr:hypothetical protein ACO22_06061 [Paracoccidioides brasiliensis]
MSVIDAAVTAVGDGSGSYSNETSEVGSLSHSEASSGTRHGAHEHSFGQDINDGRIVGERASNELHPPAPPRRRLSFVEDSESSAAGDADSYKDTPDNQKPVSWLSLPKKSQLAILTIARLSEPLTQTSLQAYIFYQLKFFDPSLPDSSISSRAGLLQGCFTTAEFATAMIWGRIADSHFMGRKRVLLIGLFGTSLTCVGFGFSKSFVVAAIFRTMGGALNSNVGVMRTMIAELIEEKKYQSQAFLLQPMCFNIGVILGPILGGILADPVRNYPGVFGPGSLLGGEDGVWWMKEWPYALPNLVSAMIILASTVAVFFGLDETHETAKYRSNWGREAGKAIWRFFKCGRSQHSYQPLNGIYDGQTAADSIDMECGVRRSIPTTPNTIRIPRRERMPFRQIWTKNVVLTILTHFALSLHLSVFNALLFVFLPTPRAPEGSRRGFFHFGGGLGMSSSKVGFATATIGIVGLPLQIFVYPRVHFRLETLNLLRAFVPFSPLAYVLVPFLTLVPNRAYLVWPALVAVFSLQVISRTFSLPAAVILVNNSIPDPSVLGTVHGVAQSAVSAARTLGPVIGSWGLGLGFKHNIVGAVWWALAGAALFGWGLTWTIFEGNDFVKRVDQSHERASEGQPNR